LNRTLDNPWREAGLSASPQDCRMKARAFRGWKENPAFVSERGQGERSVQCIGQRVAGWNGRDQPAPAYRLRQDTWLGPGWEWKSNDPEIHAVFQKCRDLPSRRGFLEFQHNSRLTFPEFGNQGRQQLPHSASDKTDAQRTNLPSASTSRERDGAFGLVDRSLRLLAQHFSCRRQTVDPVGALEQANAQFRLHLPDRGGERRLSHVQMLSRSPETHGFGDGEELLELAQAQHAISLSYRRGT
jgi:hypothetical protein